MQNNNIIANALAANRRVARNAYGMNPFKKGDRVKWRYRKPMPDDFAGWNEDVVERVNGDYIHVKGLAEDIPWKGHEGIEVLKNACGTARNAMAANRRVAKNAMTVEQQREFQKTKLSKIEATISAIEKVRGALGLCRF